jgi:integrase
VKDWTERYYRVTSPPGFDRNPKRKAYYLPSKNQAADLRARIAKFKADRKVPGFKAVEITDTDRNWIGYIKNRLGDLGKLPAVIDHWERTAAAVINKTTVRDMCGQFVAFKKGETDNRRTLADIRCRLNQFVNRYGDAYAHEVTTPNLREYLQSIPKGYSRQNAYKWLSPAFEFAKERRIIVLNPLDDIKRPGAGKDEPGIYRADAFERLLTTADARFPELLSYIAIAGLAGLRSSELVPVYAGDKVLQWSDLLLDRDKPLIHVRAEVAKQTKRASGNRRYPPCEPGLLHWIEPHRKESGPIAPYADRSFRNHMKELFITAEVTPVKNGLRHSFASFWLARTGQEGVGRLAVIMGNSESVAKSNYIETLRPGDGDAWFGIRRSTA